MNSIHGAAASGHHHTHHHPHHPGENQGTQDNGGSGLSFEDFTAMSPFLDPASAAAASAASAAALHLANPYSLASASGKSFEAS